jgi:hypothetical protein
MCEGGMREEIFFLSWGIDTRKITHFCTIYFPILKLLEFFKQDLSPTCTCNIGQLFPTTVTLKLDNGPTTNHEHVISKITILGTNHFCFRRICQPVILILDYSEHSFIHEIRSV